MPAHVALESHCVTIRVDSRRPEIDVHVSEIRVRKASSLYMYKSTIYIHAHINTQRRFGKRMRMKRASFAFSKTEATVRNRPFSLSELSGYMHPTQNYLKRVQIERGAS